MHDRPEAQRTMRATRAAAAATILFSSLALACQDSVSPPVATTVEAVVGVVQVGVAGEAVTAAPAVRVRDQWDKPMAGVVVAFTVIEGAGTLNTGTASTDEDGIAAAGGWTLGAVAGLNRVSARAAGLSPVTFSAEGGAGEASGIEAVSGNEQTGVVATRLTEPVAVRVMDAHGNAVAGIAVSFVPEGGSDAVVSSVSSTDANGMATATWTAGTRSGLQRLVARADGAGEVLFEAVVGPGSAAGPVVIDGAGQSAQVTRAVSASPSVRVVDGWGNGVPGIDVRFDVASGGGTLMAGVDTGPTVVVRSDLSGTATLDSWTLGSHSGTNAVRATAAGESVMFNATAHAGPVTRVTVHDGDAQSAVIGAAVPAPPAVLVEDAHGNPAEGVEVTFAVGTGGGSVTGAVTATGTTGIAAVGEWTMGTAGANTLIASVEGVASVTFTANATITGGGTGGSGGTNGGGTGGGGSGGGGSGGGSNDGGYYLDIVFTGTITQSQRTAFYNAAGRWASVIAGDLPDVVLNVSANACGMPHAAVNQTVDDLLVLVTIVPIDGPGGILGSAGPCYVRSSGGLPVLGAVRIDEADLVFLDGNGRLEDVLAHEFGHVIGIGTRWGGDLVGAGGTDPIFTGPTATAQFLGSGGSAYPGSPVPVENTGGQGTRDGHWRESVFSNELMTGWLNMSDNPLSSVTVGALEDMGYTIDYTYADGFGITAGEASIQGLDPSRQRIEIGETPLTIQPVAVDAMGRRAPLRPFLR
jgi:hypothetical protein